MAKPSKLKSYLQLIRLPNVFTAGADSCAGFLFIGGTAEHAGDCILLVLASMAIYAGGIALNDVFDVDIDRLERPTRPIPSGRVSYNVALWLSCLFLSLGLILAGVTLRDTEAMGSPLVAFLLVAAVVAYDARLRTTKAGPLVMGLCRGLNLMLGMSDGNWLPSKIPWLLILAYIAFVAGVTWISRNEASTKGGGQKLLRLGIGLQVAAFLGFAIVVLIFPSELEYPWLYKVGGLTVLAGIAALVLRNDLKALAAPGPQTIQTAVKTAIFSLVWLHVGVILGVRGLLAALLVSLFWFPAMYAGRWIYST